MIMNVPQMKAIRANKSVSTLLALMYVSVILDLGLMGASVKVWPVEMQSCISSMLLFSSSIEIHECNEDDHTCQHICNNTHGSFVCSCFDGYNLASNGFSCNGITIMYFRILSYTHNNFHLADTDECTMNTHACDHVCHNTPGSYSCSCRPGYTLDLSDRRTCTGNVYSTRHSIYEKTTCYSSTCKNCWDWKEGSNVILLYPCFWSPSESIQFLACKPIILHSILLYWCA